MLGGIYGQIALVVAIAAAALIGAHELQQQGAASCRAQESADALTWSEAQRAKDAQHAQQVASAVADGNARLQVVAAAGGRLGAALDRLQQRANSAAARGGMSCAPAAAASGPAASAPVVVPADVLRRCVELARWADDADAAGRTLKALQAGQ